MCTRDGRQSVNVHKGGDKLDQDTSKISRHLNEPCFILVQVAHHGNAVCASAQKGGATQGQPKLR